METSVQNLSSTPSDSNVASHTSLHEGPYGKEVVLISSKLLDVLLLFGLNTEHTNSKGIVTDSYPRLLEKMCIHLSGFSDAVGGLAPWASVIKYKLTAFYAYWNDEELPPSPAPTFKDSPAHLYCGRSSRFVSHLRGRKPKAFLQLLATLNSKSFKKCLPVIEDPEFVKAALFESHTKYTSEPRSNINIFAKVLDVRYVDWASPDNKFGGVCNTCTPEDVTEMCHRTVVDFFEGCTVYDLEDRARPFFPSTKSNLDFSGKKGGSVAALQSVLNDFRTSEELIKFSPIDVTLENPNFSPSFKEMRDVGDIEGLTRMEEDFYESLHKDYHGGGGEEGDQDMVIPDRVLKTTGFNVDVSPLAETFSKFYDVILAKALEENSIVELRPVMDPLKVRPITLNQPYTEYILKGLQKKCHRWMKKSPIFSLFREEASEDLMSRTFKTIRSKEFWNSADFKDATGEIYNFASEAIIDALSHSLNLRVEEAQLFKKSLIQNLFYEWKYLELKEVYSERSTTLSHLKEKLRLKIDNPEFFVNPTSLDFELLPPVLIKQKYGQPMGKVMSFIVLNLLNLTIIRWAQSFDYGSLIPFRQMKVLINGDDNIWPCSERTYSIWERIVDSVGWRLSVGKSFKSPIMAHINSREFRPVYSKEFLLNTGESFRKVEWSMTKFIRMNTIYGLDKDGKKFHVNDLGALQSELVRDCPSASRSLVNRLFVDNNFDSLNSAKGIPWYFPTFLGGVGLTPVDDEVRTEHERRIGLTVLLHINKNKPAIGMRHASWKVDKLISSRMPVGTTTYRDIISPLGTTQNLVSNEQEVYNLLAVETIFRHPLKDLYTFSKRTTQQLALKQNIFVWDFARNHCVGGPGLSDWALEKRHQVTLLPPLLLKQTTEEEFLFSREFNLSQLFLSVSDEKRRKRSYLPG